MAKPCTIPHIWQPSLVVMSSLNSPFSSLLLPGQAEAESLGCILQVALLTQELLAPFSLPFIFVLTPYLQAY